MYSFFRPSISFVASIVILAALLALPVGALTTLNSPAARAQGADISAPEPTNLLEGCTYRGRGPGNENNVAARLADSLCWLPADKLISGEPLALGNYELRYDISVSSTPGVERDITNTTWEQAFFANPHPSGSRGTGVFITDPNGVRDILTFKNPGGRDRNGKVSLRNIRLIDKVATEIAGHEISVQDFSLIAADAEMSTTDQENWGFQSDVAVQGLSRNLGNSSTTHNQSCGRYFNGPTTGRGYINLEPNTLYQFVCAPTTDSRKRGSFVVAANNPSRFEVTMGLTRRAGNQAVAFAIAMDRIGGDVYPKASDNPAHTEYDAALTSLESGLLEGKRTGFDLNAAFQDPVSDEQYVPTELQANDVLRGNYGSYLQTLKPVQIVPGSSDPISALPKDIVYQSKATAGADPAKAMQRYRPEWVCRTPSLGQVRIREGVFQVSENPERINPQPGSEHYLSKEGAKNSHGIVLKNNPENGISELRIQHASNSQFGGTYCRVDWQPRFRSAELDISKIVTTDWGEAGASDEQRIFQIGYACRVNRESVSTAYTNQEFIDAYEADSPVVNHGKYPIEGTVELRHGESQPAIVPERMQCQFSEMLPEIDREVPGQTVTPGVVINGNQYRGGKPFRAPHLSIKDNNNLWYTDGDGGTERQLYLSMIDVEGDFSSRTPTSYGFALTNNYRHAKTTVFLDNNIKSGEFPVNVVEPGETKIIKSELTCPGTPFAETIEFPVTNHGSELDYQTRHNISGAPAGRDCVLTATDEGGKAVISRELQLNGEQMPPAETDENGVALSFQFRFPLPEGTRAAEMPTLTLISNYVDDRKADFEVSKHIEGVSDPRGVLNPGGAVLPSDATVMPMRLGITNSGDLPLPIVHERFHMSDATLAGKTLTIGGAIENFQVNGGTQVVVPADGNLGPIYDELQCTINRPEAVQPDVAQSEPENGATDGQVLAPGESLDCTFAVPIEAEAGEAYSYPEDSSTREFYVSYQREGHETVEKEAKYSATRMSKLIDQMLPSTGVQTMVWILGLGLLALLFGLWRYLREEKEEN